MGNNQTEKKILEAGIRCIEKAGIQKATVREIAREAGVNLAAVNYHFGSKENLISHVMEETLLNAFDLEHINISDYSSPKEKLAAIIEHITRGILLYPHITRAHFYRPFMEGDASCPVIQRFNGFIAEAARQLAPDGEKLEQMKKVILQVFSVMLCTALMPALFFPDDKEALFRDEVLQSYIRSVIERLWI